MKKFITLIGLAVVIASLFMFSANLFVACANAGESGYEQRPTVIEQYRPVRPHHIQQVSPLREIALESGPIIVMTDHAPLPLSNNDPSSNCGECVPLNNCGECTVLNCCPGQTPIMPICFPSPCEIGVGLNNAVVGTANIFPTIFHGAACIGSSAIDNGICATKIVLDNAGSAGKGVLGATSGILSLPFTGIAHGSHKILCCLCPGVFPENQAN